VNPRKPRRWPLYKIFVLIVLLTGFFVLAVPKGARESLAESSKQEEAAGAAAQLKLDQMRKMQREWVSVKEKVERDRARDLWDSAMRSLEDFAIQYPEIRKDGDYERERARVKYLQAESDSLFRRDMSDARSLLAQGKGSQALERAEGARRFYPERNPLRKAIVVGGVVLLLCCILFYVLWSSFSARKVQGRIGVAVPSSDQPG
jgi:protein-S-isoprenylcysteine O-methyltransferase Ste14